MKVKKGRKNETSPVKHGRFMKSQSFFLKIMNDGFVGGKTMQLWHGRFERES